MQCAGVQQLQPQRSQTPSPIEDDALAVDDDALLASPAKSDLSDLSLSSTRSESPPISVITNKRKRNIIEDDEAFEGQAVYKAQKINQNAGHPKAGDYEVAAREVILSAANYYRALLTSQGAFPTSLEELELVKRSWKRANEDTEMNPIALTPRGCRPGNPIPVPS